MPQNPCRNPARCGVQTHIAGSTPDVQCGARASSAAQHPSIGVPALTAEPSSPGRQLSTTASDSPAVRAMHSQYQQGEPVAFHLDIGGVETRLVLNNFAGDEDPYKQVDNPVTAEVTLADGRKALAYDFGAANTFTLKDGARRRSWTCPQSEDEEDLWTEMSQAEFDALDEAQSLANEVGFLEDHIDGLAGPDRARLVITRLLDATDGRALQDGE